MVKTASGMTTWLNLAAIAAGGAIGSCGRYLITVGSAALPGGTTMLGTTVANILGCAAIGALAEYVYLEGMGSERLLLAIRVGFLGGLTTFSSFAIESSMLMGSGRMGSASLYVGANLLVGWLALMVGGLIVRGSLV